MHICELFEVILPIAKLAISKKVISCLLIFN